MNKNLTRHTASITGMMSAFAIAATPGAYAAPTAVVATLSGAPANVYTYRTYAAGRNGGALGTQIDISESLTGTLPAGTTFNLDLGNAAAGVTDYATLALTTNAPAFANPSGAFQVAAAQFISQGGLSAGAQVTFAASSLSFQISKASTTALRNTLSFDGLSIGNQVGPVTASLASGALTPLTIANATNATAASTTGSNPSAALAGSAVTLPVITITESAAGALATETGGAGQVSITLTNGTFDVASSITATWCGSALPANSLSGSSSAILTITLPSVSTKPCALVVNSKATAALEAAPGAAIFATVNRKLTDTAQATHQELQVAAIGACCGGFWPPIFPATIIVTTAAAPTGQSYSPSYINSRSDQGKKADTFLIAYYQGNFFAKTKAIAGCNGWKAFAAAKGESPQAYETGILVGATYQMGNINDCDVTTTKGVSYFIGYGVGSGAFGTSQIWHSMLANGTFSNSPVFLTD